MTQCNQCPDQAVYPDYCQEEKKPCICVGEKGEKGDQGERGFKGEKGDTGDTGAKGDKGDQGIQGAKGDKGDKGDKGIQGPPGADGSGGGDPLTVKYPLIGARAGTINSTASNLQAVFDTFINQQLFGTTAPANKFVVPATGWYYISNRATCKKNVAGSPACRIDVLSNGSALATLGINFGVNYFPFTDVGEQIEVEKSMSHFLTAGSEITVESGTMGAGAEWMADTINIIWVTA